MKNRYLRIHGDNIVECERTLLLLSQAFNKKPQLKTGALLYLPQYELSINDNEILHIELLSGYGRWGVDIADELMKNGGVLRECADSYLTEIVEGTEHILLALEYCSALPAGNNAWQRNGRAYSSVLAGVPYLYFSEIGGVELDENRNVKAPRFPNPVVPYSYLAATQRMHTFCLPVYQPHPAVTEELYQKYKDVFGQRESLQIIKRIINGTNITVALNCLTLKALSMVKTLANARKSTDTLRNDEWDNLLNAQSPAKYLLNNSSHLTWKRKSIDKVKISATFKQLFDGIVQQNCLTIGAKDLPICIIPVEKRKNFELLLKQLYPQIKIDFNSKKYLGIVWITGFKPHGDDSRPDRGLTPLARIILGDDTEILTVVYGPAKDSTWRTFKDSPTQLAIDNGLWQSIINICDYILIDSATCKDKIFSKTNTIRKENINIVTFSCQIPSIDYSEQDTDTAIHQIFSCKESMGIFECMCNPPGGDWSGISYCDCSGSEFSVDFVTACFVRWRKKTRPYYSNTE
jgi:hypothetical protein